MKKILIFGAVLGVVVLALGVAGYVYAQSQTPTPASPGYGYGRGMMGGYGRGMMGGGYGGGMMGGWQAATPAGPPLTLDQAAEIAAQYAANYGPDLEVAEVMEFSNNFYAAIREKDTGRGAFEILLDPYSGAITAEPGPNMMWNAKYGHMGTWAGGDNTLTLEQARDLAQKALDGNVPGGKAHQDARAFYGYYTFDYDLNGQTAGMLSVNGTSGQVWLHTWHGQFTAEKEISQ